MKDTKYKIKDLKMLEHRRGIAWSCSIVLDGKVVGECSNDGNGGCNDYSFCTKEEEKAFHEAAVKAHPECRFGPTDSFMTDLISTT